MPLPSSTHRAIADSVAQVDRLRGELDELSGRLRRLMDANDDESPGLTPEALWAHIRKLLKGGECVLYTTGVKRDLDAEGEAVGWVAHDGGDVYLHPARTRAALRTYLSTQAIGRALDSLGLIYTERERGGTIHYTTRARLGGGQRLRVWRLTPPAARQLGGTTIVSMP